MLLFVKKNIFQNYNIFHDQAIFYVVVVYSAINNWTGCCGEVEKTTVANNTILFETELFCNRN